MHSLAAPSCHRHQYPIDIYSWPPRYRREPRRTARPVPRPGEVFDPVGRALDRIGDRWTLVLIRHLLGGPKGFQDLRQRTGIAPRVLSARLRQLATQDWITTVDGGRAARSTR